LFGSLDILTLARHCLNNTERKPAAQYDHLSGWVECTLFAGAEQMLNSRPTMCRAAAAGGRDAMGLGCGASAKIDR